MTAPALLTTRAELAAARTGMTGEVAVVMTMGALHDGHAALLRAARERSAHVIATVFVNPLQFGAGEDLQRYPRSLAADVKVCAQEGVDLVFAPAYEEVYRSGTPQVTVSAGPLGALLEGARRPGHFDGVLTVVTKMFHLVRPDVAWFGQKDAQQVVLVRRLVADLDLGVEIVTVPTVREPDGLARSSRNRFLDPSGRAAAAALSRALHAGAAMAAAGPAAVRRAARDALGRSRGLEVDYLVLVNPDTLQDVADEATGPALLAVAARVGGTRLIDNVPLSLGGS